MARAPPKPRNPPMLLRILPRPPLSPLPRKDCVSALVSGSIISNCVVSLSTSCKRDSKNDLIPPAPPDSINRPSELENASASWSVASLVRSTSSRIPAMPFTVFSSSSAENISPDARRASSRAVCAIFKASAVRPENSSNCASSWRVFSSSSFWMRASSSRNSFS